MGESYNERMDSFGPGAAIGSYRVVRFLGEGGMAQVYLAEHVEQGTLHALKVLHSGLATAHDRLQQEGRLQAGLDHASVVAVTEILSLGTANILVMEYVKGPDLHELLRWYQPTIQQCDVLARQLLDGVAAAHERGLVHRDLKPSNILIAAVENGLVAKVADFGLAKALGDGSMSRTRTGTAMGTPLYMAPEQFRNAKYADQRADIFSVGAVLYELLTGIQAFSGEDLIHIFQQTNSRGYRPLREVRPQIPVRMERAIYAALDPSIETRAQTVTELRALWVDGTDIPHGCWEGPHLEIVERARQSQAAAVAAPDPLTVSGPVVRTPTLTLPPNASVPGRTSPTLVSTEGGWGPAGWAVLLLVPAGLVSGVLVGLGMLGVVWVSDPLAPVDEPLVEPEFVSEPELEALPERLSASGLQWKKEAGGTLKFGDDELIVPPSQLAREYNWPGRTIGNRNPGYPRIPTSPEHEVSVESFTVTTKPLTWRQWKDFGGQVHGELDTPVIGVPLYKIERVLNAKSRELGLEPAMTEGSWNGANGLRIPTEAEWEFAREVEPSGLLEFVLDPEPVPSLPGKGKPGQVLRGRDVKARTFHFKPSNQAGFRLATRP